MKYFLIFFLLLNVREVFGASAVINKVYHDRIEASAYILDKTFAQPGYFFSANFQNGNVCNLEILEVKGDFALLDLRPCSMKEYIRVKQKLGSPLKNDPDVDVLAVNVNDKSITVKKDIFWAQEIIPDREIKGASIFLGYSSADTIDFLGLSPNENTGAKNSWDGEINAEAVAVLGIDYLSSKENHFGWNFNGSLEFPRNFNYVTASTIGVSYDGPVPSTSLWLGALAINLNYTFPKGFIPYLGINVSLPVVNGGNLKLSAQFGLQGGLSKVIGNHWIADLEYRWMNFRGGEQLSNEVIQFTAANFPGFLIRLKYLFN